MIKKFNKRQLIDQCGFTSEETQVILDYQKKLPILVENDDVDGFCINARDLWNQLEYPNTEFRKWVDRKFTPYGFKEDTDYSAYGQKCPTANNGYTMSKEYMITIDMAKSLAMIDKRESGILARRYFILMEKAVKKNTEWELIRYPLREGYKKMQTALNDYMNRMVQRDADDWDYRYKYSYERIV